jgi:hypothetical protein
MQKGVAQFFRLTGLGQIIPTFDTVGAALEALGRERREPPSGGAGAD